MKPHPSLKRFVRVIEEIAREYVVLRRSIISGDATAPTRTAMRFPRGAILPELDAIEASDSDSSSDDGNNSAGEEEEEDTQLSDDELGLVYDTSFDYEEEEKTEVPN
ncbi:hypothetical protein PR003_g27017 [Phytophthora rubi]|nr:hypothetical protein PR003_g27017 [Phytophthora rubi]